MTSLCWIPPLHLYSNQHFSNALLEVPNGVHSNGADNKIFVSENLTTTSNIKPFPFSKIMTTLYCLFFADSEAKPLRWLLWHCHTTSKYAVDLPLGKCHIKSDKIQTLHDFREKHNVSKTRTNLNQRAMQISPSNSQSCKSKRNMDSHSTLLKWKANWIMVENATLFFIPFLKTNQLSKPLRSNGEVYFLWQHQCFNILLIVHHKIANLVSRCEILSPIWRQRWKNDIQEIISSIHWVSISLFHCQIRMVQIYAVPTVDSVLDLSQDICHLKAIQSDWWNHDNVTHIVATSNSLSSIHLTPNQGYHWLELKSKPENFSNLSEASFLNPSRNGIARLMPYMIQLFSCRCEPRVRSIRHVKSQVQRLPSKAVSQSQVCSNLIWITKPKRKVQLPSRQKNEMSSTSWIFTSLQNTLSFQLANLKSWR